MNPWEPEREITADLAARLIQRQFPELVPHNVHPFGSGWDNTAFLVNGELVFRFPRREAAVPLLENECRLLPIIAPRVPVAVPVPLYVGDPSEQFPWPFAGYRLLPGLTAASAALPDEMREDCAEQLGRFLSALHSIPAEEAISHGAGQGGFNRFDFDSRVPLLRERLAKLAELGLIESADRFDPVIESTRFLHPDDRRVLLHGDLYSLHLLVDSGGRITGIIDWGDVHLGHPAVDVSVVYALLPSTVRPRFFAAYGDVDDHTVRLAQFRALDHEVVVALYAYETDDENLLREARASLRHLADD